jgi:hypothetical protein
MKEARVGIPTTVGKITIIPLEAVGIHHDSSAGRLFICVSKEPIGIVISSPQGKWAINIHGQQVSLEHYIQSIKGLQKVLDAL